MSTPAALVVFARLPAPGEVKTRLVPPLSGEEAARLYDAFLRDALDQYQALDVAVRLYLAPPADPIPPDLVPEGMGVHLQHGDDLAARLLRAFVESFAAGFERIVAIGTDHPTLPTPFIEAAFEALEEPLSAVVGPSDDGGYYLIGMNELYPSLFQGMAFSRPDVFEETVRRAGESDAALVVLPPWYDVDRPADVSRLARELEAMPGAPRRTREAVAALRQAHPEMGL
jgi:rSAM/selenodomain-associated transferase 1